MAHIYYRKILLLFLFACSLFSCSNELVNSAETTRLALFIDSFDKANPKYYDYESVEEKGDSMLKTAFLAGCRRGLLIDDFPFILHDIGKSLEGQYYAHFTEATSVRTNWQIGLDLVIPITDDERHTFTKEGVYKIKSIKSFEPVTKAWIYNVDLHRTVLPYLIRENEKAKVINLGTNYTEATIVKE